MWDGYHNFAEFREAYEREYNEKPYISPTQTSKWYDCLFTDPIFFSLFLPPFLAVLEKNNHKM